LEENKKQLKMKSYTFASKLGGYMHILCIYK
jgi:hypothetical protein